MSCLNKSDSKSQDKSNIYTVYIRDIFVIRNVGCIAAGVVEGAAIRVGDDVNIIDANGNRLRSKVMKIENPVEGSINIAPAGYAVGILLENIISGQLHRGDIITNEKIEDVKKYNKI